MGITKRGDGQIRAQVAHGARSVVSHIGDKQDSFSCWIQGLIERRRFNQVAIFFRRLKPSARLVTDQCEAAVMLAAPFG